MTTMKNALARCITVAVLGLACAGLARASGGGPTDEFVTAGTMDLPRAQFQSGALGIVRTDFPRAQLYYAWRAIALGAGGLAKHPVGADSLDRAQGTFWPGWQGDQGTGANPGWSAAAGAILPDPLRANITGALISDAYPMFLNCPGGAFDFATQTLQGLRQRADAAPARLADWVAGQDRVFSYCDVDAKAVAAGQRSSYLGQQVARRPPQHMPEPLAASEPLYWRQLRDYQIAAAHFYAGDPAGAAERFAAIGRTAGHPMQSFGAYLALRANLRAAQAHDADPAQRKAALAALQADGARVLGDASLAAVHESVRATLRRARSVLGPADYFDELSAALDDPAADPATDDRFGDWRLLADARYDFKPLGDDEMHMRAQHPFFDWIRTLQRCGLDAAACAGEAAHARAAWGLADDAHGLPSGAGKRLWLVAALCTSAALAPDLAQAALAVPEDAPEYPTVQYQLARLHRLQGDVQAGLAASERGLAALRRTGTAAAAELNLFARERFALTPSFDEAVGLLIRSPSAITDVDTRETAGVPISFMVDYDGVDWLQSQLGVRDLMKVAQQDKLPPGLRRRLAAMAWMRAGLLADRPLALEAAALAQGLRPELAPAIARYRAAATADERRHVLLVLALTYGLEPMLQGADTYFPGYGPANWNAWGKGVADADDVADGWCRIASREGSFAAQQAGIFGLPARDPGRPVSGLAPVEARDAELARLRALRTATGVLGDDVLAWARTHPADPQLPWLLHVFVQSTRGGCLDADSHEQSKKAYALLHARHADSEWAKATPYWY